MFLFPLPRLLFGFLNFDLIYALTLFSTFSLLLSLAHLVFPQLWTSDNQVEGEDTEEARE